MPVSPGLSFDSRKLEISKASVLDKVLHAELTSSELTGGVEESEFHQTPCVHLEQEESIYNELTWKKILFTPCCIMAGRAYGCDHARNTEVNKNHKQQEYLTSSTWAAI